MSQGARRAAVGVGSNVNPNDNVSAGLAALEDVFGRLTVSPAYRSAPAGGVGAPFLNLVVTFQTTLDRRDLQADLRRIEHDCGRERGLPGPPRVTLDLDLLILGEAVPGTAAYALPADELITQAHVLCPLAEVWPDFVHPDTDRTLAQAWRGFDRTGLALEPVVLTRSA